MQIGEVLVLGFFLISRDILGLDHPLKDVGLYDDIAALFVHTHHPDEVDVGLLGDGGDGELLAVIRQHSLKHPLLDDLGNESGLIVANHSEESDEGSFH